MAQADSIKINEERPKRIYTTQRIQAEPPEIDGRLDDNCWLNQGEWAGNFEQFVPYNFGKASRETEFKILYDDHFIYAAFRCYDEPENMMILAGRRDMFRGDIVGVGFDSYHDLRTSFEFNLTAAGVKIDLINNDSNSHFNWDPVWYGKTGVEDSAWVAEMKIPLSQLRFPEKEEHVWGLHIWRWFQRYNEEDQWNVFSNEAPSWVDHYGELHGIKNLKNVRRIELLPYGMGRQKYYPEIAGNPYADGTDTDFNLGLDGKIGVSSNFTLDFTFNPDFGQVEADPSSLNLTSYETFFDEKRPFFLEGKNIFDFKIGDDQVFYSRRIGHRPSYYPGLEAGEYAKIPDVSTILNAVKLSGKTRNGLSVGVIQSITSREEAEIQSLSRTTKKTAEPVSNYFVARLLQDYRGGNTAVGGIMTSTNRFINDDHLNFLSKNAYTAGVDLLHQWQDKTFFIKMKTIYTRIDGDKRAMSDLQTSPRHYFQRPGADYVDMDTSRTDLSGNGGSFSIGKAGNGRWHYSEEITWRSPGLDFNDVGYMRSADNISQQTDLSYVMTTPNKYLLSYTFGVNQGTDWDFGGMVTRRDVEIMTSFTFLSNWSVHCSMEKNFSRHDNFMLRGGPAMRLEGNNEYSIGFSSDYRQAFSYNLHTTYIKTEDGISSRFSPFGGITLRVGSKLNFSTDLSYSKNLDDAQYVGTTFSGSSPHYILGRIDQETTSLTLRADICITPDFTIQYYGSPYLSSGKYSHLKRVTDPTADEYKERFHTLQGQEISLNPGGNFLSVDENLDGTDDYSFGRPDFNFQEFRSNLVVRWEYKPGSTFYFVWTHDRSGYRNEDVININKNFNKLFDLQAQNIFMVKFNYWFML